MLLYPNGKAAPSLTSPVYTYRQNDLVEIELAQGFFSIRSFFRFTECLGELLCHQIILVPFRVDGLAENTLFTLVLLPHCSRGRLKVFERSLARRGRVGYHGARHGINFEYGSAIGAGHIKRVGRFDCHGYSSIVWDPWDARPAGQRVRGSANRSASIAMLEVEKRAYEVTLSAQECRL